MNYPKISNKKCKNCNGKITIKRKRDEDKQFCSNKCCATFLFTKPKVIKICPTCNKEFKTNLSNKNKYCSRKCAHRMRTIIADSIIHTQICEGCGTEFILSRDAFYRRTKFCSISCSSRKYNFDESYFDKINTPEKAYWLGFLYADGNVCNNLLKIKLKRSDEDHLTKFKESIKSEHPIRRDNYIRNNKTYYNSTFSIYSTKLCIKLFNLGMIPNKSLIIEHPKIFKKYESDFIRGYFDGDGCIYVHYKYPNCKTWSIGSGSKKFILKLKEILENRLNIKITFKQKKRNFYSIHVCSKLAIQKIFNFMYKNSTIHLERKYNKFLMEKVYT